MRAASDYRAEARANLAGKWGRAVLVTLIYMAVAWLLGFVGGLIPFIGTIIVYVVAIPLSYGMLASFIRLKRDNNFSYSSMFTDGINNFKNVWLVVFQTILKLIAPIILMVVAIVVIIIGVVLISAAAASSSDASVALGIAGGFLAVIGYIMMAVASVWLYIKGLYYSLVYYILYDNPNMPAKEIVNLSESMMQGQRANYFVLQLSFIGWGILAAFTCGIGYLFLAPYMQLATIAFYEDKLNGPVNLDKNI